MKITAGNRLASTLALLISGLLSPLPGGYVNWGRYAQLTGQAILPVAIYFLWVCIDNADKGKTGIKQVVTSPSKIVLASITLCGMVLSYYRLLFNYGTFFILFLLLISLPLWIHRKRSIVIEFLNIVLVGLLFLLLFLPWLLNVQGGTLAQQVETSVSSQVSSIQMVIHDFSIWKDILTYIPFGLLILSFVAFIYSIVTRNVPITLVFLWYIALSALVFTQLIRLPAAIFLQNFSILISLYIPISIVGGWLIEKLVTIQHTQNTSSSIIIQSIFLALFFIGLTFGIFKQTNIVDQNFYGMLTRPDIRAMKWIDGNTPKNAYFLLEGMSIPPGNSIVGTDGGWWLGLLTARPNTMPPQYAHLNETPKDPNYNSMIVELVRKNRIELN